MVPVTFSIGCDVYELRPVAAIGKAADQTVNELFAAGKQPLEGNRAGDRSIVEEDGDGAAAWKPAEVGDRRIDPAVAVDPRLVSQLAPAQRLAR